VLSRGKHRDSRLRERVHAHGDANAKSLAHCCDGTGGSGDDILRVPCIQGGLLDPAGMAVYRRRILGLWGTMGFGRAGNVLGRLVGPAVIRTTSHALVVGWCRLNRGRGRAAGGCAHSRRPLFRSELNAQQLSLRRRCDADRLVGDGPRSYIPSQPLKSEPPVPGA
jgi:hypothetical protein